VRFDKNLFTCSCERDNNNNNNNKGEQNDGFKFGTFIGRFPSDGAAGMAVKWLTLLLGAA